MTTATIMTMVGGAVALSVMQSLRFFLKNRAPGGRVTFKISRGGDAPKSTITCPQCGGTNFDLPTGEIVADSRLTCKTCGTSIRLGDLKPEGGPPSPKL